ncbi:hypothetical protein DFH09DRAFT_1344138 [Mycena vulgaris]|nr:hypothetical protein DFH09DRAFT_1344138 [Mycena vulgaris]
MASLPSTLNPSTYTCSPLSFKPGPRYCTPPLSPRTHDVAPAAPPASALPPALARPRTGRRHQVHLTHVRSPWIARPCAFYRARAPALLARPCAPQESATHQGCVSGTLPLSILGQHLTTYASLDRAPCAFYRARAPRSAAPPLRAPEPAAPQGCVRYIPPSLMSQHLTTYAPWIARPTPVYHARAPRSACAALARPRTGDAPGYAPWIVRAAPFTACTPPPAPRPPAPPLRTPGPDTQQGCHGYIPPSTSSSHSTPYTSSCGPCHI